MTLWAKIKALVTEPFVGEMDLAHLFLLIGAVLVFLVAWGFILGTVRRAASEVVD